MADEMSKKTRRWAAAAAGGAAIVAGSMLMPEQQDELPAPPPNPVTSKEPSGSFSLFSAAGDVNITSGSPSSGLAQEQPADSTPSERKHLTSEERTQLRAEVTKSMDECSKMQDVEKRWECLERIHATIGRKLYDWETKLTESDYAEAGLTRSDFVALYKNTAQQTIDTMMKTVIDPSVRPYLVYDALGRITARKERYDGFFPDEKLQNPFSPSLSMTLASNAVNDYQQLLRNEFSDITAGNSSAGAQNDILRQLEFGKHIGALNDALKLTTGTGLNENNFEQYTGMKLEKFIELAEGMSGKKPASSGDSHSYAEPPNALPSWQGKISTARNTSVPGKTV